MGRPSIVLALLLVCASASRSDAQDVCRAAGPHLDLVLDGAWPAGERGAIAAELRAALRVQDLDLCIAGAAPSDAIARLTLSRTTDTVVNIRVRDAVTDKWVERDIDLTGFDAGARSLAIAVAADELVRASWTELLLDDAPETAAPPPPQVRAIVDRVVQQNEGSVRSSLPLWIDVVGNLERYVGGELHGGGGLTFELWLHRHVGARLGIGGRVGRRRTGQLGSVRSRGAHADLDLSVGVWGRPDQGTHLVLTLGGFLGWTRFHAEAAADGVASDRSGVSVGLRGGAGLRQAFGRFRLLAEVSLGGPLAGVAALDGADRLTAVQGFTIFARLGLGTWR